MSVFIFGSSWVITEQTKFGDFDHLMPNTVACWWHELANMFFWVPTLGFQAKWSLRGESNRGVETAPTREEKRGVTHAKTTGVKTLRFPRIF